ncbi:MAG: DUF4785 domain-containing protein [Wenzhouxiangella sp.]
MNSKKTLISSLPIAAFLVAANMAHADVTWLDVQNSDLRAASLEQNTRVIPASLHHETASLNFSWTPEQATAGRVPAAGPSETVHDGAVAESRSYWLDVSGADLAAGIGLPLSAPGAVIRISALDASARLRMDADRLDLSLNGRNVLADFGPEQISTGQDLRAQGMSVPESTLAFRLPERSSVGTLEVSLPGLPADQALVIHVYEPNSPVVARLSMPRSNVLSGERVNFALDLGQGRQAADVRQVQAVLSSPDASETWPIQIGRANELALEAAPVASRAQPGQGLYEAHVYVEADFRGQTIKRDLTLAFNIAPATARFSGEARRNHRSAGLALDLGVETAVSGRYQVNAEILGTNARGQLEVLGYVQSAAVLDAGRGVISLEMAPEALRSSGLAAPFEVRNLQLLDQGRMALLEHRGQALRVSQ